MPTYDSAGPVKPASDNYWASVSDDASERWTPSDDSWPVIDNPVYGDAPTVRYPDWIPAPHDPAQSAEDNPDDDEPPNIDAMGYVPHFYP